MQLLSCPEASLEPAGDFCLVLRTGEHAGCTPADWNHGMASIMRCQAAAGTPDAAGGAVREECRCSVSGEPADFRKLFEMLPAPDERNREIVDEQERDSPPIGRPKRGPTRITGKPGWTSVSAHRLWRVI